MNVSSAPIELYVNLKTILRVLSASPQQSTGLTPFELMNKAPVPRLFSQLQPQAAQLQERKRTSVPQDKVKPVRKFKIGDSVLVYDILSKVNSNGTVKDIKSNNSYVVFVNGRDKHISGDHLSLIVNNDITDENIVVDNSNDNIINDQIVLNIDNDSEESDDVYSDSSDSDDEIEQTYHNPRIVHRKYRNEAQKLQDRLSKPNPNSRLRPRNNV